MSGTPGRFVGWEAPPSRPDATTWRERINALNERRDEWAKYGPYSERGAKNLSSQLRDRRHRAMARGPIEVVPYTESEGNDVWWVYVRVRSGAVEDAV
jgi:hypothetical protein